MTRRRFVQIDGVLYERGKEPVSEGPMIFGDIKPYRSMIDGSIITSRSQHREHLKANGCVEIGNDIKPEALGEYKGIPDVKPEQRKELIRAQIDAMSHAEFKRAKQRAIERVKWNSRQD